MLVVIDYREKDLYRECLEVVKRHGLSEKVVLSNDNLAIGDIIIRDNDGNEKLIIERKSVADLASSISDGRYKEQSLRLQNSSLPNHNILYMIEGSIETYKPKWSRIDKTSLYSSIVTLNHYKGFSILKTNRITESAEYIIRYADKIQRNSKQDPYYISDETSETNQAQQSYTDVIKRVKKDNITSSNIHAIWLSQLPYVSGNIANVILSEYKTLWTLRESLIEDPACLDNLTTTTATGKSRTIGKNVIESIKTHLLDN